MCSSGSGRDSDDFAATERLLAEAMSGAVQVNDALRRAREAENERDDARGEAEKLAVVLKAHGLSPCAFRPLDPSVDVCKTCDQQDACAALEAYEESKK